MKPRIKSISGMAVVLALLVVGAAALTGCAASSDGNSDPATEQQVPDGQATEQTDGNDQGDGLYTPSYVPNGSETAVITTSKGEVVVSFFGKDAPVHVGNFVELARKGFYDGTKFHRYVEGFVVQGGDPQTRDASSEEVAEADGNPASPFGMGNPGYQIKGEFDPAVNPNKHEEGALGMARSQSPDSAGSQFYFALAPLPQLDGGYTVFGKVTEGMDVVKSLRAGDVIEKVVISGASE